MTRGQLKAGLIGHPVDHSLSPVLHRAAARAADWAIDYALVDIAPADLANEWPSVVGRFDGFNVTAPLKRAVAARVDRLSGAAQAVGAVNTVGTRDAALVGHNTDVEGFLRSWGGPLAGRVLVLGAGGAARAVVHALAGAAPAGRCRVEVFNRSAENARAVASLGATPFSLEDLPSALRGAAGLVNCLPPLDWIPRLEFSALLAGARVRDLNYGDRAAEVVAAARRAGCEAEDGLTMLTAQGCAAFRWWTGVDPPFQPVLDAVRAAALRAH